jgi:hypothetical protein
MPTSSSKKILMGGGSCGSAAAAAATVSYVFSSLLCRGLFCGSNGLLLWVVHVVL